LILLLFPAAHAQRVGIVLSGGGADGLAHVGVLKALEENGIRIDYVTGTSMGALIGGMYASGYSPAEMEEFFTSSEFLDIARGQIDERYQYYLAENQRDASLITIRFSRDSIFKPVLPTNLIATEPVDYDIMERLAVPGYLSDYCFDSLMVGFRCVAADIYAKRIVIFRDGNLSTAVRASMSYPFYIRPLTVDGSLLFDGGLYNNFPVDPLCEEFQPDVIIGSNTASEFTPPSEDDLISQVKGLMVSSTEFNISCAPGIVIKPNANHGVFQFQRAKEIIDSGYVATLRQLDSVFALVKDTSRASIQARREAFNARKMPLTFGKVEVEGLGKNQTRYCEQVLNNKRKKDSVLTDVQMRKNFFRLASDRNIKSIYPIASKSPSEPWFTGHFRAKQERELSLKFGGNFASRPISHGFVGVQYNHLSRVGITGDLNSYFGRLYAAGHARFRMAIPARIPFYLEPFGTIHRWNYFESRTASLFSEERPSYVIQRESIAGMNVATPFGTRGKIMADGKYFKFRDDYYQSQDFSPADTADETTLEGYTFALTYEQDNLNDLMFPTQGKRIIVQTRFFSGSEQNEPGSTSRDEDPVHIRHEWVQARFEFENYFFSRKKVRVGLYSEFVYSTQEFLSNYTSTIIRAPAFQPIPDSRTLFLESFRANQFGSFGLKWILQFTEALHIRAEGYVFQPYQAINKDLNTKLASYGDPWESRYTLLSATAVYQSIIGPVSLSVNYYNNVPEVSLEDSAPITVLFNFGYILFNRKALR